MECPNCHISNAPNSVNCQNCGTQLQNVNPSVRKKNSLSPVAITLIVVVILAPFLAVGGLVGLIVVGCSRTEQSQAQRVQAYEAQLRTIKIQGKAADSITSSTSGCNEGGVDVVSTNAVYNNVSFSDVEAAGKAVAEATGGKAPSIYYIEPYGGQYNQENGPLAVDTYVATPTSEKGYCVGFSAAQKIDHYTFQHCPDEGYSSYDTDISGVPREPISVIEISLLDDL